MFRGSAWSWGSNAHGAIGVLDIDEKEEVLDDQFQVARAPRFLRQLSNITIVQVACGNQFSAVLTSANEVWTWGNGQHGKLGHLDQTNQPLPKKIESLDALSITKIACGQEHMMCIANGGSIYSWGCGFFGRLGHAVVKSEFEPKEIKALATNPIVDIWCGATSFAKDNRGSLWAWGSGGYGQIGRGDLPNEMLIPVEVGLSDVKQLACSERHVMAISGGHLYGWGSNSEGQLGLANFKNATKPTRVIFPILPGVSEKDFEPLHVSCGRTFTAVVTPSGVYTFGSGDEGELGTGSLSARTPVPTKVKFPPDTPHIVKVSCGETFMAALTNTNLVYAWGSDKAGQLGMGELLSEDTVQKSSNQNTTGTRRTERENDLSIIMDLTPKKAKKTRNPATPAKKKEPSQVRQATTTTATAMTNLLVPRQIKWLYGVQDVTCGHSHSVALVDYQFRMHQLARDGDVMSAKAVLAEVKNFGDARRRDPHVPQQYSLFHWACMRNHSKLVSYLVQHFAEMVNQYSHRDSHSPLHVAAIHGHADVVRVLIDAKAETNARDSLGNTPLHYAGNLKRLDICSALILGGASADVENHKSKKALEYFSLQEVFELKKSIKVFDVAIYYASEDYEFAKELKGQVETFHIVCSLNEEKQDAKAFIKASRAMIFILSNSSATSHDSLHHIRIAKEAKKLVYPIWLHKATMGPALESLIYRNQLVDFTDRSKMVDSTAQLVAGLRNIFEDKKEGAEDHSTDDTAEVDAAFSTLVPHPDMSIAPDDLRKKKKYVFLCHDILDAKVAALLAVNLCNHGFIVCYYNEDPRVIGELITDCWAFLLVLSSRSAASSVIRDQIALAENRQKLILPVLVQKSPISLDPSMTYTLARTARFPFFVGDKDVHACIERLVDAVRLAKKVSEKSERLKNLREEVVVTNDKLNKSNKYIADIKSKVKSKKTVAIDQPENWR